ncbi:MAG: HAMP domain-containing protein, partial [Myxococcales bacterium]|nr:HAMP domain-containing protein [Myxococcales bacterium]
MRLQSKQIAALLAMALLPLAVATVLLVRSNTWQLSQQAREFRLAVADSAKRATLAFVDEASTELATLGGAFLRTELGLERIKALVQATLKGTRRVNQVALYAKSGALALSYRAAEAKVGVTPPKSLPTSLVQIAPTRDFLYLGVVWQQGRPFLPIVMALFKDAARKEAIGFVYTAVDLTPLSAVMRELSVRRFDKEPGYIQLIAPDFRFLAHGVAANVGQSASSAVKTSGINFKSDVGVTTDDRIGGKDVLVALLPVIEPGWAIVVAQPRDAAYAAVRNIKRTALFVGAGCLVLAIFGGWLIGRRLSRPILRIAAAAKRVATGDFSARVEARGKDEVGELAQSFNQMSGDLETYKQTLIDETAIRSNLSRYLS